MTANILGFRDLTQESESREQNNFLIFPALNTQMQNCCIFPTAIILLLRHFKTRHVRRKNINQKSG